MFDELSDLLVEGLEPVGLEAREVPEDPGRGAQVVQRGPGEVRLEREAQVLLVDPLGAVLQESAQRARRDLWHHA